MALRRRLSVCFARRGTSEGIPYRLLLCHSPTFGPGGGERLLAQRRSYSSHVPLVPGTLQASGSWQPSLFNAPDLAAAVLESPLRLFEAMSGAFYLQEAAREPVFLVAAGTWTVGLAISGNCVGLSLAEWNELPLLEQQKLRGEAAAKLRAAGADYVIDSIAELVGVVEAIEATLTARQGAKQPA